MVEMGKSHWPGVPFCSCSTECKGSVRSELFESTENLSLVPDRFGSHFPCFEFGSFGSMQVRRTDGFNISSMTAQTFSTK